MAATSKTSAGILLYRGEGASREVLLVHFGGPFFRNKDLGSWQVPKGEVEEGEDLLVAARREFAEELGITAAATALEPLGFIKQKSGKTVHAWAAKSDFDPATLNSNTFEMEWPKGSGRMQSFPEIDRAEWFTVLNARVKIIESQQPFLDRVAAL